MPGRRRGRPARRTRGVCIAGARSLGNPPGPNYHHGWCCDGPWWTCGKGARTGRSAHGCALWHCETGDRDTIGGGEGARDTPVEARCIFKNCAPGAARVTTGPHMTTTVCRRTQFPCFAVQASQPPRAGCAVTGLTEGAKGACAGQGTRLMGRRARKTRALGPTGPPRLPAPLLLWCTTGKTCALQTAAHFLQPAAPRPVPHRGGCGGSARARGADRIAPCPTHQPRGDPGGGVGPRAGESAS